METTRFGEQNLSYQSAPGVSGGSYTEKKLQALHLPPLKGKRFLDLGCNAGFYCGLALQQGAKRVVGVDTDPKVIAKAREQHRGGEFFDGGWDRFPEGEFDVVICLSAIHYAADPIALVDHIHAHLAPGGLFVLEGGLFDADGEGVNDILVPSWRKVGDRCRHLSRGFVANHLLRAFNWQIVGTSEMRGGDPVPRVVIHALSKETQPESDAHDVDLVVFAKHLAVSAQTIVPAMPSYRYVRALGAMPEITTAGLSATCADGDNFRAFVDDLIHALGRRRPLRVTLAPTVGEAMLKDVCGRLEEVGITPSVAAGLRVDAAVQARKTSTAAAVAKAPEQVTPVQASVAAPAPSADPSGGCRTMSAYIPILAKLPNNAEHGVLKGKVVADLGTRDPALPAALLAAGAAKCYVLGAADQAGADDSRIQRIEGSVWGASVTGVDVAFFDARGVEGFEAVRDVTRLLAQVRWMLNPGGALFAILQSSYSSADIDVVNSIVFSTIGPLPSSPYLYEELLRNYSVRMLDHPLNQAFMVTTRLFRIMEKKPTLLLIFGHSQAGKTSLAREFKALDSHAHVSTDYIFYEIARLKRKGASDRIDPEILSHMGDGSGNACGDFNRELDVNTPLLTRYLAIIEKVIPVGKSLLTMEFDLRRPEQYDVVKTYFSERGYSVWTVTR